MSLLNDLMGMFGGQRNQHQATQPQAPQWQNRVPVGQPLTQQDISRLPQQAQANAQIYNSNPRDPRVEHMDPAQFGYAPDGPENKPFKMYEDNSFQGDPSQFMTGHPGFKFYEDNNFSAPQPLRVAPVAPPRMGAGWSGVQQSTSLDQTLQGNQGIPAVPTVYNRLKNRY